MKHLERYNSVLKGESPARFKISKKVSVSIDFDSAESKLWEAHTSALYEYQNIFQKIANEKINLNELDSPEKSLLDLKVEIADRILESCHFCERKCSANRKSGETGRCGVTVDSKIASEFIHMGEEPELIPSYTIFFSGCTFNCQFCQNWDISQNPDSGVKYFPDSIASLITQKKGRVKNVNWVGGDPTPNLHTVLKALNELEVNIPSVWNSNMYLSDEGIKLLSGTQDIYLTDFKYGNNECATKYSKVQRYWKIITRNHKLAFEDAELIIRHLVLPEHLDCCTKKILRWIKDNLVEDVRVNIMGQYRPQAKANDFPEISRRVTSEEMDKAFRIAEEVGLTNIVG